MELAFDNRSAPFTGGEFTYGSVQDYTNAWSGIIYYTEADGTPVTEAVGKWGDPISTELTSDNTLTVEFGNSTDYTGKKLSFYFSGPYENTGGTGEFVPVENIQFPATHPLMSGTAELNSHYPLNAGAVMPANATGKTIEWTVYGASRSDDGSNIIFDKPGTATVMATIKDGMLATTGNKMDYVQQWMVTVTESGSATPPNNALVVDGQTYPIVKTEFAPARQWFGESLTDFYYTHDMKFYTSETHYLELAFDNRSEVFTGGEFTFGSVQDYPNAATGILYYTDADGTPVTESIVWGGTVQTKRATDNTLTVEFDNKSTDYTGKKLSFHFSGPYENTGSTGGDLP
jgi:hypothetical protein